MFGQWSVFAHFYPTGNIGTSIKMIKIAKSEEWLNIMLIMLCVIDGSEVFLFTKNV